MIQIKNTPVSHRETGVFSFCPQRLLLYSFRCRWLPFAPGKEKECNKRQRHGDHKRRLCRNGMTDDAR
ncbi:hypothetical protein AA904_09050 [Geobacillus stearothermophilus]|nr:hypothetical protein AA906_12185 [Geobacillus stearothermophilus]KMY60036.1 hypothetical protein AA905_11000 [Geobacillus stearothermophilus]KMY60422.1 hypothetical protein AA904_09050 [Geobacillus stearothermophilus]